MAESDRGIHPDLIEEVAQERDDAVAQEVAQGRGSSRRGRAPRPSPPTGETDGRAEGSVQPSESPDQGDDNQVDWREAYRQAESPEEAFKLLAKNLPSDVLSKDETLSGFIGSRADQRARDLIRQQQRDAEEQRKREAAANNDLYTLGELAQKEYLQQAQQNDQVGQLQPLMDVITRFQQTLPESVQHDVAGKTFGEGKPWNEGLQEYLSYLVDQSTELRLKERESALRKSILSEVNGNEPVPEREGGTPARVRVVTDEQVAAMSLREYDALFDENGHPRPGVQHRSTRGIPIQRT